MKRILTIFLLTIGMSLLCEGKVYIVSNGDNLFQTILLQEGVSCQTVCSADEALRLAGKGDGIIVTATDYPTDRLSYRQSSGPSYPVQGSKKQRHKGVCGISVNTP